MCCRRTWCGSAGRVALREKRAVLEGAPLPVPVEAAHCCIGRALLLFLIIGSRA
jgi:hypothetical protein